MSECLQVAADPHRTPEAREHNGDTAMTGPADFNKDGCHVP